MRLWLIRHGETEHNIRRVFQGQLDTPLTERGRHQAELTAAALGGVNFDRIYASDLARAFDTAQALADGRSIDVEPDIRLRELHYGVLQGVAYSEFRAVLREHGAEADWGSGVFSVSGSAPPGGESLDELIARTAEFVDELTRTARPGANLAAVTHGGTIRSIMTELLGMPPASRAMLSLSNCGVTCFSNSDGHWQLEFHNRVLWSSSLGTEETTV
jgi:broad specificity phosphatase PhoE